MCREYGEWKTRYCRDFDSGVNLLQAHKKGCILWPKMGCCEEETPSGQVVTWKNFAFCWHCQFEPVVRFI